MAASSKVFQSERRVCMVFRTPLRRGSYVGLRVSLFGAGRRLARDVRRRDGNGMDGVASELVPKRGEDLACETVGLAGAEAHVERQREHGRRDGVIDALLDCPAALARVFDVAGDLVEAGVFGEGIGG